MNHHLRRAMWEFTANCLVLAAILGAAAMLLEVLLDRR